MKMIQVRNVPDDLHRALKARAAQEGTTLSDYILAELPRLAHKPSAEQVLARVRERTPVDGPPAAEAVARHVADHEHDLHAPHLVDVEVLSAVRRLVGSKDASLERAAEAITDLLDLPIARYRHDILVPRVWELRKNFSSYDATYLALAEALTDDGIPLLTADKRL